MNIRPCICIPTYNNPNTILKVTQECLEQSNFTIFVIDDGSDTPVSTILQNQIQDNLQQRLFVIRKEKNEGKGLALQEGLKQSLKHGFTHMVSIDGDGQHLPSEIPKLISEASHHPWDLVIGSRKLHGPTVPEISRFGRKFSNFWVKFQTSNEVSDSQSGFRVYPLFHTQNLSFWTKKFDFEIEVLIKLIWKGVGVKEVVVDVHYPNPEDRVSHFDKFSDNVRISLLNTLFVVLSLLRSHRDTKKMSLAVGLGVFVGCTPFFGFHSLIVAGLSFALRLNFVFLWLGSQVSIPPLTPFVIGASIAIGKFVIPSQQTGISEESFIQWLAGSFILGISLGFIATVTTALVSSRYQRLGKEQTPWNGRSRGGVFGNWVLRVLIRHGGLKAGYAVLYFIIPYFYLFAPKARKASSQYWKTVDPALGFWKRQWRILQHLLMFAKTLMDRVHQAIHEKPQFKSHAIGWEYITSNTHKNGLIVVNAHAGGWDLATALLEKGGFENELYMIHYQPTGISFTTIKGVANPKNIKGLAVNKEESPILKIRELLSAGKTVGLMGDRPIGRHFELVKFFGKLAPFDVTPYKVAAACQTPVLFAFGFKESGNEYRFMATPPKNYSYDKSLPRPVQTHHWVQEYAQELEKHLKNYPLQWFNFFPFWSSQPGEITALPKDQEPQHLKTAVSKEAPKESESEPAQTPTFE